MKQTRIVILGGGYGGVEAAKSLHRKLGKRRDIEIVLVDKNPYHTFMTELHEVAGGRVEPKAVALSFAKIFGGKKVTVVTDRVTTIDFKAAEAGRRKRGVPVRLPRDRGRGRARVLRHPGHQGVRLTLWSLGEAMAIRRRIDEMFSQASKQKDPAKRAEYLTFVIAGAGFTGMELAGELKDWRPTLCIDHGIDPAEVRIVVVEAVDKILPTMPPRLQARARRYLERRAWSSGWARRSPAPSRGRCSWATRDRSRPRPSSGRRDQGVQVRHQPAPVHRAKAWEAAHQPVHADHRLPRGVRRGRRGLLHGGQEAPAPDRRDCRADGGHCRAQHHGRHRGRGKEAFQVELPRQHGVPRRGAGAWRTSHGQSPCSRHLRHGLEAPHQRHPLPRRGGHQPGVGVPQARVPRHQERPLHAGRPLLGQDARVLGSRPSRVHRRDVAHRGHQKDRQRVAEAGQHLHRSCRRYDLGFRGRMGPGCGGSDRGGLGSGRASGRATAAASGAAAGGAAAGTVALLASRWASTRGWSTPSCRRRPSSSRS